MRNRGYEYEAWIRAEDDGATLLDHLTARYDHSTREEWRSRVEAGAVLLDDRPASPDEPLRRGQRLRWLRPGWVEPVAPRLLTVLHRDDDLLAVDKPSGLPTLPGAGYLENTLLAVVRESYPGAVPVHRLGRWTSGLVLFALSARARSALSRDWRERRVGKGYLALAVGSPAGDRFDETSPIGLVPYAPLGRLWAASPAGKPARSRIEVLSRRDGVFLARVTIDSGRPHQIRIHLAAAGHPLVGDPLYGPGGRPLPGTRARPGDPGYALHAECLALRHPATGEALVLRCEPPPGRLREDSEAPATPS